MSTTASPLRFEDLEALSVNPLSLPVIIGALAHESWRVRRLAADKLAQVDATPQLIASLIFMLCQRGDPGARNAAAMVLGQLGPAVVDPLVRLLSHPDSDQRKFAADIFGQLKKPEAVPALIATLADEDPNVQAAAAEALGRTGGHEAIRALEGILDSTDPLLRVCSLEGLTSLRVAPPLTKLRGLLENPLTRRSAHRSLGLIQHPTAWALVVMSLQNQRARDSALVALSARTTRLPPDLETEVATALRHMPDARDWLADSLVGDDEDRRMGALQVVVASGDATLALEVAAAALGPHATPLALDVLLRLGLAGAQALLKGSPPALVHLHRDGRALAGEAILQLASPVLVEPLVALMMAGDDELADLAARALGRTGALSAIEPLVALFLDDHLALHARRSLVQLAQSWPAEVRKQLAPVLAKDLKPHAVRAWGAIAGAQASEVLRRALRDENDGVRAAAAESVTAATPDALGIVGAALVDESARVRRAATHAIGLVGEGSPYGSMLARALTDPDPSVLAEACTAAAELGARDLLPRLTALVAHPNVNVVLSALDALSGLAALSDELLAQAVVHADPEVVKQALTLGADRPVIITRAVTALEHERWDIRVAAARALSVGGPRDALIALHRAVERETDSLAREFLVSAAAALAGR